MDGGGSERNDSGSVDGGGIEKDKGSKVEGREPNEMSSHEKEGPTLQPTD